MKNLNITQKLVSLIVIINVMLTLSLKSQNLNWDKSYAPDGQLAHGNAIQPVHFNGYVKDVNYNGGYIACGSTLTANNDKDIYLLRLNTEGDTLWTKTIGGAYDDEGYCVRECNDGGFVIAGYTASYGNGGFDFFLVKTNLYGAIEWTRTNGGTLNEGSYNIIQTNDSGFLAVGYTYSTGAGGSDVKAVKYDKYGQVQFTKTYGNAYNQFGYSVCQMRDSGYVIAGSTARGVTDSLDVYVIRTNLSGDTLWTHTYKHLGYDCAYAVQPCLETGFVIAGKTNLTQDAYTDMLFMRIFDDGTPVFTQTYGVADYNEVAYDVKETDKNNFVLAGTTNANSQGIDGYVVHTTDRGELLEQTYYGTEGDDDFKSVCITDDNTFVAVGTVGLSVGAVAYSNCLLAVPRTLWFQDCWEYNSGMTQGKKRKSLLLTDNILTDTAKMNQLVAYCRGAKIHTLVLGRLEDIIRQGNTNSTFSDYPDTTYVKTNGDTLRLKLFNLVYNLHTTGKVAVVLAHWREEDKEDSDKYFEASNGAFHYPYDEDTISIKHNLEILKAFKVLNNAQPIGKKFDGIMLDYEYFTPLYGNAPDTDNYRYALPGFIKWNTLADSIVAARGYNGINFIQAYLARVVFTAKHVQDSNYFNYKGIGNPADDSTDIEDSKAALWHIDSLRFNKLSLAFFVDDQMQMDSADRGPNPIPTTFLSGFATIGSNGFAGLQANGGQTEEQRYRHRLEILGNDPGHKSTCIEPVFLVRNTPIDTNGVYDSTSTIVPMLGNLMLGGRYWATHDWPDTTITPGNAHFLPDIEKEFYSQFINQTGIDSVPTKVDPYFNYGNIILGGVQWYQYSTYNNYINPTNNYIVPLSYQSLSGRGLDSTIYIDYCGQNNRVVNPSQPQDITLSEKKFSDKNSFINIFPNPMSAVGSQIVIDGLQLYTIKFIDAYGSDITTKFSLEKLADNKLFVKPAGLLSGVYLVIITEENKKKHIQSFSVIK